MKDSKEINYYQLITEIKNKNVDYIAVAMTPWHAFSLVGAIKKVIELGKKELKGIVLMTKNSGEEYLINPTYFSSLNARCLYFNGERGIKQLIYYELKTINYALFKCGVTKFEKNFYVFSHYHPFILIMSLVADIYYKKKNIIAVECDEGIGTYVTTPKERMQQCRYNGSGKFKILKNYFEELFIFPCASNGLKKSHRYINMCLLSENLGLLRNGDVSEYIENSIKEYAQKKTFSIPKIGKEYILINTQIYSKLEVNNEAIIDELWYKVVRFYLNKGIEVWIKPHPRDQNLEKYRLMGAQVLEIKNEAQEVLLTKMPKPKYIIGIDTTTLVTAKLLNGINTICLAKIIQSEDSITEIYRKELQRFCDRFHNIVSIIDSFANLPD